MVCPIWTFGKKISNVVLNIFELLFETPDFSVTPLPQFTCGWCSLPSKLWEQHLSFFHRLFWVSKEFTWERAHLESLFASNGPLAYNCPHSWDHVLMTWCTHSIRKPLGSWLQQLGKIRPPLLCGEGPWPWKCWEPSKHIQRPSNGKFRNHLCVGSGCQV